MCEWQCYLIMSLDSKETYIGSSNNPAKRLCNHNRCRGAKRTKGRTWIPIVIVSGFHHKNACLSFESGWKRLAKRRTNARLFYINQMCGTNLSYTGDSKWNRIMDLLYFVHNVSLLDTKYRLNYDMRHPLSIPDGMIIEVFLEDWFRELPWPYFVEIKY